MKFFKKCKTDACSPLSPHFLSSNACRQDSVQVPCTVWKLSPKLASFSGATQPGSPLQKYFQLVSLASYFNRASCAWSQSVPALSYVCNVSKGISVCLLYRMISFKMILKQSQNSKTDSYPLFDHIKYLWCGRHVAGCWPGKLCIGEGEKWAGIST